MKKKPKKRLTPKQNKFCYEYILDCNATQAAIRAGYSPKRASEIGYQLLQKTTVVDQIQELVSQMQNDNIATATEVLESATRILRGNIGELATWSTKNVKFKPSAELTDEQKFLISEIAESENGLKLKLNDKTSVLKLLAKYYGMNRISVENSKLDKLMEKFEEL